MKPLKQISWIASPQWVKIKCSWKYCYIWKYNTDTTLKYENSVYCKINNDEYNIAKIKNKTDIFYNNATNKVCN